MSDKGRGGVWLPVALIVIGSGWLMHRLEIFPSVNWIVILALLVSGFAVLLLEGINKSSIVIGPMLIAGGVTTFFQQQYDLARSVQIPLLLILCGLLMLLARSNKIAEPPPKPWERAQQSRTVKQLPEQE
ncbi:hypothetical protein HQ393_03115 [Chitinibacter bivalviorum]|uniref:Uncharacterized protein n=1 Tax=Chitinibacter bivalviorum TaxID=2739434 RepID=A0A7H9BF44_9NEIS|nr:hypothetical protein [Chitinibacter bivalviorum]QLG87323.1 hypothetical protein HQ393_03115 [Chitinibacter bivalviorum]